MLQEKSERVVYSVAEIMQLFHLSKATAYAAVKSGAIPSLRIGGRILIPKCQIDKMLQSAGRSTS